MIIKEILADIPKGIRVRLLFQDESRFGRISDHRRCWAPLPMRPLVSQQVVREFLYVMAAVSPSDGQLASLIMPWVDTEIMSIFLAHVTKEFSEDFCLIFLDGAGWHKADELRIPKNMKILFLPPYSPELNPVESLWEHLRKNYFGNRVFGSLQELENCLCQALNNLINQPQTVKSLTNYDWLNTLCLTYN